MPRIGHNWTESESPELPSIYRNNHVSRSRKIGSLSARHFPIRLSGILESVCLACSDRVLISTVEIKIRVIISNEETVMISVACLEGYCSFAMSAQLQNDISKTISSKGKTRRKWSYTFGARARLWHFMFSVFNHRLTLFISRSLSPVRQRERAREIERARGENRSNGDENDHLVLFCDGLALTKRSYSFWDGLFSDQCW